ncbi:hypothetical protein [Micromonospora sediminimaris]|uniref:Uncharacterized protein n=1 Tax=Micromonospora sediminimaris TaxID=547162 RepID=A0A9W5UT78_9ACTN|nr:hypothetical protein [Micromonospora sediminimaris]GIJ34195.1 hypothetical protein Vse01_33430 [Micromonospora sediminimaris]SFD58740.1 hypothetical protein SAMN05216284_119103 [Micromonospora sediminimaris]
MRQERDDRPWAPSVLAALLVLAVLAGWWCVAGKMRQFREASDRGEAAAAAELDRRVGDYAEAVIAAGAGTSDDRLRTLAAEQGMDVWEIRREPELSLVVQSTEAYGPWPDGLLQLCHRLDFRALGAPDAGSDLVRLPSCPTPPTP